MTQDEIIETAREAGFEIDCCSLDWHKRITAFANLVAAKERKALAQPEQETVAYWKEHAQGLQRDYDSLLADFQAQRTWVGLTGEEVNDIVWSLPYEPSQEHIRAIETKLKEKNT
jgi:hypothetical protein